MTAFARRCAFLLGLFVILPQALVGPGARAASSPVFTMPEIGERIIGSSTTGVALHGVDTVAYFALGKAVPGKDRYELHHAGALWRFASLANREAFASNPDDYMPLFGGYDPVAISQGRPLAGSPEHFAVIDGKLALFASAISRNQFVSAPGLLAQANAGWPAVAAQLAR